MRLIPPNFISLSFLPVKEKFYLYLEEEKERDIFSL